MSDPKVSVVMSVYNNVSSVDASIQSIIDQTFSDWEMILWNDASIDGSEQKLFAWQQKDVRIKVYSNNHNAGLAASLNKALEKASGQYLARMDGDDIAFPDRLQKQVGFLDIHPQYAFVSAGCVLFDGQGEWGTRFGKETPEKRDFLWGSAFLHPATVFRRDALLDTGGYRVCRETLRTEDYDLFMRMYAKGYIGYNIHEPLLYYFESRIPKPVKYTFRCSEARIRYQGFKLLGLMPKGWLYVIKPLLVGLLPGQLKRRLQKRRAPASEGDG